MPSLTVLDLVLAAVMLISGFLAMIRGLTRELLSIAAWIAAAGAAGITYFFYKEEIKQLVPIQPEIAAIGGVSALVFLVVLIVVSLLTIKVGDWVLDSSIGALDRTLGLLFGLARGMILVGIIFWFFIKFTDDKAVPTLSRMPIHATRLNGPVTSWKKSVTISRLKLWVFLAKVKQRTNRNRSQMIEMG